MGGICVIAPTRGRVGNAQRLIKSFHAKSVLPDTDLMLVLDDSDTALEQYHLLPAFTHETHGNMVQRSNEAALEEADFSDIIGWCADDNVFVTDAWDEKVAAAFTDPTVGLVNTNDLLVGNDKGGVYFIRACVVKALGYLLLPDCEHLYVDFAATELHKAAGSYLYRDDIVIEHLHPYAGKAEWDTNYRAVNNPLQDERDRAAYYAWRNGPRFREDIEKVKACLLSAGS